MQDRSKDDAVAAAFERAEKRLTEWGFACRLNSDELGLPRVSGIRMMIEHVQREDRLRKGVRKKNVRQIRTEWRKGKDTDAREAAEAFRYIDRYLTAYGKQSRLSGVKPRIHGLNDRIMRVDAIVARMPKFLQSTVIHGYHFGQPDENACRDLRMRKSLYKQYREAAVEYVAERLAEIEGDSHK